MKSLIILGFLAIIWSVPTFAQSEELEELTHDFITKYTEKGKVHYQKLAKDPTELKQLSQIYGLIDQAKLNPKQRKTLLINAYNLFVIEALVDVYPTVSPMKIPAFFTKRNHLLMGKKVSLDELEKKWLDSYVDPRLHFALICGANGCPPFPPFAFRSEKLDELLDKQTRLALNDPVFIRYSATSNSLELSEIFKWYVKDFKTEGSLLDYINQYRQDRIPKTVKQSHYDYDWNINAVKPIQSQKKKENESELIEEQASNLQLFTPSALFQWGEYEINNFNTLYYQNSVRDKEGEEQALSSSQAFFTALFQFTTGIPKIRRLNVGIDVNVITARYGPSEETPADFYNDETAIFKKTIVSSIGPRIKYVPFEKIPRLSIQSTFLFPVASDQEEPFFIFHDRYTWFTQFFFDQNIGDDFQLFAEADLLYRFNRNSTQEEDFFRVPLSAFLSYFPTANATVYVFSQYSPRYQDVPLMEGSEFGLFSWFTQLGVGAKYQITPRLGAELSYADFVLSENDGAGYAVNFGLRYIYR